MKKTLLTLLVIGLAAVPFKVLAQEDLVTTTSLTTTEETLVDPGLVPGDTLYFLEGLVEQISLLLTFDDDTKLEKELLFAEERLSEIEAVSETADEEVLGELENKYEENIANAIFLANKGENKENRLQVIEQARLRHTENMQRVYNKAPEQAKGALEKVLQKSQIRLDDIQNRIEQESQNGEQSGDLDRTQLKDRVDQAIEDAGKQNQGTTPSQNSGDNGNSDNGNSGNGSSKN